ncbi:C-terminal binding protein [Nocardia sp. alder85J]|uniref:C-terminal binding protein n=1 Tax=Nocardia sp. alder85J TaxID=2862949 RepID=UPI001CD808CC|nr:C-terminal binding protein [Nocardia sp. alder85J]MCX4097024.1 C-terminal binding protein [Nocardia sp. alder85J]
MPELAVYTDIDDLDPSPGVTLLEDNDFRVRVLATRDPGEIAAAAAGATALLAGYAPVGAQLLDRLPRLRIVSLLSQGSDTVDMAAATARGVWVASVGDAATEEVATHAWALALALVRRLDFFALHGRRDWLARPAAGPRRLSELTLGLIGLGRTGTRIAALAAGSVRRILGHGHGPIPAGVTATSLDEVVARSDLLSLHLPLTAATAGLIDARRLAAMPPGAWLVNVSRGGLVDAEALADALDSGHLAGAALDVLDTEPPPAGDRLAGHPRVLLTPHIAYLSDASARDYVLTQARNVVHWRRTGRPLWPVAEPAVRS